MATLDNAHHEIEIRIVVMGGASDFMLASLPLKDGKMQLHELQGWKPALTFAAFPTDPWAADGAAGRELVEQLPRTDALVLTDALGEGQHYSSNAVERLTRALIPAMTNIPVAIFGCRALEEEWTSLTGVAPVRTLEPVAENALPLIKAICAILLRSRLRSTPPPPPR